MDTMISEPPHLAANIDVELADENPHLKKNPQIATLTDYIDIRCSSGARIYSKEVCFLRFYRLVSETVQPHAVHVLQHRQSLHVCPSHGNQLLVGDR
jgi:hypothetical protein